MKHQYFGDISDYKKYGVLRCLASSNIKLLVCWMLTEGDLRTDGNKNSYLLNSKDWRHYDEEIYDFLYDSVVVKKVKNLNLVKDRDIVPNTSYYEDVLIDSTAQRKDYFQRLEHKAKEYDLVFFDPDNGIATSSIVQGRKNSSKFIFLDELNKFWTNGHSLLVYQHFPRVERMAYINKVSKLIGERLNVHKMYAIKTSLMVYFLIPQAKHEEVFANATHKIVEQWRGVIDVLPIITV